MISVTYLGDNRDRNNYGCRATSMALADLIGASCDLRHHIYGNEGHSAQTPSYWSRWLPHSLVRPIFNDRSQLFMQMGRVFAAIGLIERDYIFDDLESAYRKMLELRASYSHLDKMLSAIDDTDALVINGEGTFIFTTPPRREYTYFLVLMKYALSRGKKVALVNTVFAPCPLTGWNEATLLQALEVFKKCSLLVVRDPYSLSLLGEKCPELNAQYVPDALFTWNDMPFSNCDLSHIKDMRWLLPCGYDYDEYLSEVDLSQDYIVVSGGSLAVNRPKEAAKAYSDLITRLRKEVCPQVLVLETAWKDRFLRKYCKDNGVALLPAEIPIFYGAALLANARLFVSGRYHPSILASLGGAPCVFMGSNSHKNVSLQEILGYEKPFEYPAIPSSDDINSMIELSKRRIAEGESLRDQILRAVSSAADKASSLGQELSAL